MRSVLIAILLAVTAASAQTGKRAPDFVSNERFLMACEDGDVRLVKDMLGAGVSPNIKDKFGQPAFLRAARGASAGKSSYDDRIAVFKTLMAAGADINTRNEYGSSPLFLTAGNHYMPTPVHLFLLEAGADRNIKDKWGLTFEQRPEFSIHVSPPADEVFWRLTVEGDLARVDDDAEAVSRHSNSASPLMAFAYYGISAELPASFIDPRAVDDDGSTYLFYLAARRNILDADMGEAAASVVNVRNRKGETALVIAAQFDNDLLVLRLLKLGADPDIRDSTGRTALWHASQYDYFLTTLNLLTRADPNLRDRSGATPLINAAKLGNLKAVGAFVMAKTFAAGPDGADPRSKAGSATAAAMSRIDPDKQDLRGRTALMYASELGHIDIIKGLLKMGASRELRDKDGMTALQLASKAGKQKAVQLLGPAPKPKTNPRPKPRRTF